MFDKKWRIFIMAKQVSPGVLALRKVVDDVHKDAREAKREAS